MCPCRTLAWPTPRSTSRHRLQGLRFLAARNRVAAFWGSGCHSRRTAARRAELPDLVLPDRRQMALAGGLWSALLPPGHRLPVSRRVLAAFLAPYKLWCVYIRQELVTDPSPANTRQ